MYLQSLVKKSLKSKYRWYYFEYKLLLGKWTVKITQKNFSIYRKTTEVGIAISKIYFWISLSEMIQGKQALKYTSNKAFRENKSW